MNDPIASTAASTAAPTADATPQPQAPSPWWRHGHVWLVIAGPVAVVIAGVLTMVIAMQSPDPLVAQDYYRRGIEINRDLQAQQAARAKAVLPAMQGRNHAASPAPAQP